MGMFDYLKCEYPLPERPPDGFFQTKDTPRQYLEKYTITTDGRLVHHAVRYEEVPENERPYWGNPGWENPLLQHVGSVRSIPTEDVVLLYFHGDLYFYTFEEHKSYKYIAHFIHGKLQYIEGEAREHTP